MTQLLEQQYVDEAILLAETVAAVEEVKDQDRAYKVIIIMIITTATIIIFYNNNNNCILRTTSFPLFS